MPRAAAGAVGGASSAGKRRAKGPFYRHFPKSSSECFLCRLSSPCSTRVPAHWLLAKPLLTIPAVNSASVAFKNANRSSVLLFCSSNCASWFSVASRTPRTSDGCQRAGSSRRERSPAGCSNLAVRWDRIYDCGSVRSELSVPERRSRRSATCRSAPGEFHSARHSQGK